MTSFYALKLHSRCFISAKLKDYATQVCARVAVYGYDPNFSFAFDSSMLF